MQSQQLSDYTQVHAYKSGDVVTISGLRLHMADGDYVVIKCGYIDPDNKPVRLQNKPKKYRSTYNSNHGRVW